MSKKNVDRATAVPTERMVKKQEKIDGARKQIGGITNSPDYAKAAEVKARTDDWSGVIDGWEANSKQIASLLVQLATLQANEPIFARRWAAKKRDVFSAITDYADGSIDTVKGFACGVLEHPPLPPAGVPQNLRDKQSKAPGTAAVEWDRMNGRHDFMVQHATDPADPATYSDPAACGKASFKLTGQTRGAIIHFRVLTIDPKLPNGKSDWTPWVSVLVL